HNRDPPDATPLPYTTLFRSVFLGAGVELSKGMAVATAAMAGMLLVQSGAFKVLNLLVFLTTSLLLRGDMPAAEEGLKTDPPAGRSEEHTSELQSRENLVCRL